MLFCPRCSNLLLLGTENGEYRFVCQTCPYSHAVTQQMYKNVVFEKKEVAEVEGEKNWSNEDSTVKCPTCHKFGVYFHERQTRSADEPATLFFKCKNNDCRHQWKEG